MGGHVTESGTMAGTLDEGYQSSSSYFFVVVTNASVGQARIGQNGFIVSEVSA